jgi:hypothetical protein
MSLSSESSTTSYPTDSTPKTPTPTLLTVPNMNLSLHVKLNKRNFISWKTQVDAYLRGQDAMVLLMAPLFPHRRLFRIPSLMWCSSFIFESQLHHLVPARSTHSECADFHTFRTSSLPRSWVCYVSCFVAILGENVLLAYELRLEQHLPIVEIIQPSANFSSRSQEGRGRVKNYRGGNRGTLATLKWTCLSLLLQQQHILSTSTHLSGMW